jgi:hypothetical protein
MKKFRVLKTGKVPVIVDAETKSEAVEKSGYSDDLLGKSVQVYEIYERPASTSLHFDQSFQNIFL